MFRNVVRVYRDSNHPYFKCMSFNSMSVVVGFAALAFLGAASPARSQTTERIGVRALLDVTGDSADRARMAELRGGYNTMPVLLRSTSGISLHGAADPALLSFIPPAVRYVSNSDTPFSVNDGALWAGRGGSWRVMSGFIASISRVRIVIAPELNVTENRDWVIRSPEYYAPPLPKDRAGEGYVLPYYTGRFEIDLPVGFGRKAIQRIDAGQSSVSVRTGPVEWGAATESEWWGPAIRNAAILSSNAPGIPRLFLRTARPLQTRLGKVEGRWFVGGLQESAYFDTVSTNNLRSIAALAVVLRTGWDQNLSFGLARTVFATARGWNEPAGRWLDVFANTGHPSGLAAGDSSERGKRDQLLSLFGRWVFPDDGAEVYAELARTELPASLRQLMLAPNHTAGYTLGFQWVSPGNGSRQFRVQGEATSLEQSPSFRDLPTSSFYTSRRVPQGYTHRGQAVGAGIGPGASSQWLAGDVVFAGAQAGAYLGRIRWNEDVHSNFGFPTYVASCNHDVSIYPGLRGSVRRGSVFASADLMFQNRQNMYFQNGSGCPNGAPRRDVRNTTLTVTLGALGAGR